MMNIPLINDCRKLRLYLPVLCGLLLPMLAGCSNEHPAPPVERSELVIRFFRSIRRGQHQEAVRQGYKMFSLDEHNSSIQKLIAIQESNVYIKQAQRALNRGDVNGAVKVLAEGRRAYPANTTLTVLYSRVRQLRNAEKLIAAMQRAKSSTSMEVALSAATTGLSSNISPRLAAYFRRYEKDIARVRKVEEEALRRAEPPVMPVMPEVNADVKSPAAEVAEKPAASPVAAPQAAEPAVTPSATKTPVAAPAAEVAEKPAASPVAAPQAAEPAGTHSAAIPAPEKK